MNELVTYSEKPVQFYSVRNMDYDAIEKKLDEEAASFGRFPGEALTHDGKRGKWRWGYGTKATPFDHNSLSFVFNLPNAVEGWQKFVDKRPVFGPMVYICGPDKLPDRASLGDTDERLWSKDEKTGKVVDPWKQYVACPVRFADGTKVNHLFLAGFWANIKFKDLMKKFAQEGRRNIGKLPVVNIGTEMKPRKDAPSETFDVPTFAIVDWDAPLPCDEPEGSIQAAAQIAIPDATVTTVQRTAPAPQTTVEKLQEQANASAAGEIQRREQTVQQVTEQAGASAPTGRRRGGGEASPSSAQVNGLFVGAKGSRRSGPVSARQTVNS